MCPRTDTVTESMRDSVSKRALYGAQGAAGTFWQLDAGDLLLTQGKRLFLGFREVAPRLGGCFKERAA